MKRILIITFCWLLFNNTNAQISTSKVDGGTVITKLGVGISVNTGSSLHREWIIVNNENCPIQLGPNVGINAKYVSSRYRFHSTGNVRSEEAIVAYEIHHVLYDVFGGHIKTLSNLDIIDFTWLNRLDDTGSWYASESQISKYFSCVSYISTVRTNAGVIWRFRPDIIKEELSNIQISYEEGYLPTNNPEE